MSTIYSVRLPDICSFGDKKEFVSKDAESLMQIASYRGEQIEAIIDFKEVDFVIDMHDDISDFYEVEVDNYTFRFKNMIADILYVNIDDKWIRYIKPVIYGLQVLMDFQINNNIIERCNLCKDIDEAECEVCAFKPRQIKVGNIDEPYWKDIEQRHIWGNGVFSKKEDKIESFVYIPDTYFSSESEVIEDMEQPYDINLIEVLGEILGDA